MKDTEKMFGKKVIDKAEERQPSEPRPEEKSTPHGTPGRAAVKGRGHQESVAARGGGAGLGNTTDRAHGPN